MGHEYRVQVWSADTGSGNDFGVLNLVAEFENAKNIGYAYYLNDIGEAFWTINQDDVHATSAMRGHFGTGHVKIIRDGEVVWRGVLAELDANHDDVIMYAYGYEHIFYHLITKWNQTWKNAKVAGATGRPINDLWTRCTTLTNSQLQFASTGTIQAPVTTSDGGTEITLELYKTYFKRILHAFKELVAMAVSDTTNVCYFELDYGTDPAVNTLTFNFWKDNAADITTKRLEYPGAISSFSDRYVPIYTRNDIRAVGTGARDQLFRNRQNTTAGTFGGNAFGARMEPIYFNWVRDEKELIRVTKRRAAKARREDINVYLRLWPDDPMLLPMRAASSGYELGDRIKVVIDRGITQVDKWMFLEGEQVIVVNGMEYVQPIFSDRAGS